MTDESDTPNEFNFVDYSTKSSSPQDPDRLHSEESSFNFKEELAKGRYHDNVNSPDNLQKFKPGVSGNPNGRPLYEVMKKTRDAEGNEIIKKVPKGEYTLITKQHKRNYMKMAERASQRLLEIALYSKNENASVSAIREINNRAFGSVTQRHDIKVEGSIEIKPMQVFAESMIQAMNDMKLIEGSTPGEIIEPNPE
jgi:hypothetical protein